MKRILLKISGEAFSGPSGSIDINSSQKIVQIISDIQKTGVELVIVIGGGNIYRGSKLIESGLKSSDSHNMSMLSTVFNAVTLKNLLEQQNISSTVFDALGVEFLQKYSAIEAREEVSKGNIVICSSGTGTPYFTTDSGGVIRALETECDIMIKLTQVDGVYDSDPKNNPDAEKFDVISYDEFIAKDLKVLDQTAIILARDNELPIVVMKLENGDDVIPVLQGEKKMNQDIIKIFGQSDLLP